MSHLIKKISIAAGIALALVAIAIPASRLFGSDSAAVSYLKSKPISPWSIMALSAAGESPSLEGLKTISGTKAIDLEAPILALTAAGKDPRSFGSENLVAKLKIFYDGTQLGEANIINDDIFGLLALIASGEIQNDTTVSGIKNFILSKQEADGGFSFAVGGGSDTNTTAAAIMALRAAKVPATNRVLQNAVAFLKTAQNNDGGFPYDPKSPWGTASDASSDAWVIMAATSLNEDPATWQKNGNSAAMHLLSLRQEGGYFLYQQGGAEDSFTPVTTSYALLALSGKTLPLQTIVPDAPKTVSATVRIEGKDKMLCDAEGTGITAFDALKFAAESCGIAYHSVSSALGEYIDEIAGEKAAGAVGWLYTINGAQPSVGAGSYTLYQNDRVLWYFGEFSWKSTRFALTSKEVASKATVAGTVEFFDGESWKPLVEAVIKGAGITATSNESGTFQFSISDGQYALFAEKDGFVRSNNETVTVGTPAHTDIPLSITIPEPAGEPAGGSGGDGSNANASSIGVLIEGNSAGQGSAIGFGAVPRGTVAEKSVTLRNNGTSAAALSASVSGDSLFRRFLKLNRRGWRNYRVVLPTSAGTTTVFSIAVPSDYEERGTKTGSLTFWATAVTQ